MSSTNPAQQQQQQQQQTLTIEQAIELARAHQFHRRLPEAEAVLRQVVAAAPARVDALNELGMVVGQRGQLDEAEAILRRAVELSPGYLPAWHNLAVAAERRGLYEDNVAYLRRAAEVAPDHGDTLFRLAQALKRAGQPDESLRVLRRSIALNPNDPEARGLHANFLLLHGDYARGWDEYEVRWQCPSFPDTRHPWTPDFRVADLDLRGRHVVVYGEQGFGDMIQFARYAPLLAERGADVTVVVPPDLRTVLTWLPGRIKIATGKTPPSGDYLVPMMSLPRAFGTALDTIPATTPYLTPPTTLVEKWRARVNSAIPQSAIGNRQLRVGIAWAGRPEHKQDRDRTVRLAQFVPLAGIPGVSLFMLQKGPAAAQANPPPAGMEVVNLTAGISDFADTAGLIAALDLVISVDTAVVHLAGALGKPVWTLLAASPDFRWLLRREDTPWYPTMRLFRQPGPGQWEPVFARVADELRTLANGGPAA